MAESPPSPRAGMGVSPKQADRSSPADPVSSLSTSIPIPAARRQSIPFQYNAVAGPSSEGQTARRPSAVREELSSSAPPTPSVISMTHPPQYIHTHHPRRGSLTPLGLNVISPVPPPLVSNPYGHAMASSSSSSIASPIRSVGFNPSGLPIDPISPAARRGSTTSTSSTLTQSRPPNTSSFPNYGRERRRSSLIPPGSSPSNSTIYPPGFNPEPRRASLTPSVPTLAPPSPSRAHAKGRHSRPTSSDGADARNKNLRSAGGGPKPLTTVGRESPMGPGRPGAEEGYARRGSLPHLHYGGWTGPHSRPWNPSLPPQRPSIGEDNQDNPVLDEGFKFGGGPVESSAAASALRAVDTSPSRKSQRDVFDEAEADEAEKQRKAFIAATFGEDGKRARERLSIGGPGGPTTPGPAHSPTSLIGGPRRPSLMLWEKLGMASSARIDTDLSSISAPAISAAAADAINQDDLGPRRGSLPINIPAGPMGRTLSRRSHRPNIETTPAPEDDLPDEEDVESQEAEVGSPSEQLLRPLPPLLPLSDPGPRHLPSTLALHRATHLLNSRNLQVEPLPHPLPPSLHPPAPVDLTEFDIDFILAGSRSQLGKDKKADNSPVDVLQRRDMPTEMPTPTLRLGADEEDSFARFVGKFDDEYGDRRGEWTFRVCTSASKADLSVDPTDTRPRAEWEAPGAGKYELYTSGEVKSSQTGSIWRVSRLGAREYMLDEIRHANVPLGDLVPVSSVKPTIIVSSGSYVLAGKGVHRESGGAKTSAGATERGDNESPFAYAVPKSTATQPSPGKLRVSISESAQTNRTVRMGSNDSSSAAARSLSSSVPLQGTMALFLPKKSKRRTSRDASTELSEETIVPGGSSRGRDSAPASIYEEEKPSRNTLSRSKSKDRGTSAEPDDKGKKSGFFKRGLMASIKSSNLMAQLEERKAERQERERERVQSSSWGGYSQHQHQLQQHGWVHPTGKVVPPSQATYRPLAPPGPERAISSSAVSASTFSSAGTDDRAALSLGTTVEEDRPSTSHTSEYPDELSPPQQVAWTEGKGWHGVPEDAVAMVIPIQSDLSTPALEISEPRTSLEGAQTSETRSSGQALLVWYVPFNSDLDDRPAPSAFSVAAARSPTDSQPTPALSSSLPKFQKLLRRRASKDYVGSKREQLSTLSDGRQGSDSDFSFPRSGAGSAPPQTLHPLPFRSFRIVARVVDIDELRSEPVASSSPHRSPRKAANAVSTGSPATPSVPLPSQPAPATASGSVGAGVTPMVKPPSIGSTEGGDETLMGAPAAKILEGRTFPTVIAVCHSRSQGVEFVLEGLDRLGFCKGESAWGPTGYEEWRGSGLSEKGRELVDLLWSGCTGVMGLMGI